MFLKISQDAFQFGHNPKTSAPRIIIEILEELQITLRVLLEFFRKFDQKSFENFDKITNTISMFILVFKCCTNSCMLNRHVSLLGTQITSSSKHIIPWNSTLFNPCASVD